MTAITAIPLFINIFRFFSLVPPILNKTNTTQSMGFIIWFIINILFVVTELTLLYFYRNHLFHSGSLVGYLCDLSQVLVPIFTHLTILLETIYKRKTHNSMWTMIEQIDNICSLLTTKDMHFHKRILINLIYFILFGALAELCIIFSVYRDYQNFARGWYFRIWSLHAIRFGMLQLIFYIEWINGRLDIIAGELKRISAENRKITGIYVLKELYLELWRFKMYCNYRFNWSILMAMLYSFVGMVASMYFIIARFYFNQMDLIVGEQIICDYYIIVLVFE